ncbi:MAG: sortase domain-bontaining protein [Pikeienuella sp.]
MKMTMRHWLGSAAIAVGFVLAAFGAWVPAKAWVGQRMLTTAFLETQNSGTPIKPWPWADFSAVARITVPRIGAEAIALDASTGAAMAWGPGAVPGLDRLGTGPVAFAGHRDTHLAFLADLRPGDMVEVEGTDRRKHIYRVTGAQVIDSRKWRFPMAGNGLMLATCWPLNATTPGPLRLIISAKRVT